MDSITLEVAEKAFTNAKEERGNGRIPIAYYGKGVATKHVSADYQDFRRAYEKGGRSTILNFKSDEGNEFPVIVHDIQYHPVSDRIIHVDVLAVDLKKVIRAHIPIKCVGQAPAIKELGGILIQNKDSVEVECLPKDLIHEIEVDIAPLVDFHSSITIAEINIPDTIKILDSLEINIVTVSAPRSAIEEEATPVSAEEEAEGGEKKEGENGGKKEE